MLSGENEGSSRPHVLVPKFGHRCPEKYIIFPYFLHDSKEMLKNITEKPVLIS